MLLSRKRRAAAYAAEVRVLERRTMPSVAIQIDYSYDSANFFDTQAKRDLLQSAADTLTAGFSDQLSAITPSGNNTWTAGFTNPATGAATTIDNLAVPANTIIVYAGARDLQGPAGIGGPGSLGASGTQDWLDNVASRGQPGALDAMPTDFGPWGGSITFDDSAGTNWYFGQDASGLNGGNLDFFTIAEHELAHVLGFGTSPSWTTHVSGSDFAGPASEAAHGGLPVPLDGSLSHWADGTMSTGLVPVMVPSLTTGERRAFTMLDFAGLEDLGWAQAAAPGQPPVLDPIGNRTVAEGHMVAFSATAHDPDNPPTALSFSLIGAPAGATISPATGAFFWTPTEAQGPGDYTFTVRVTDAGSPPRSADQSVTITVIEVNSAPVLAPIGNRTTTEGSLLVFAAPATDPDLPANSLTYSLDAGAPAGASINPVTGVFSWIPTETQGGASYAITVRVTDNGGPAFSDAQTFIVNVNEANSRPVLASLAGQKVVAGSLLRFKASARDADVPANVLTFRLVGAPAGATINPITGVFSWKPTTAQGGHRFVFSVVVTDSGAPTETDTKSVVVNVLARPRVTNVSRVRAGNNTTAITVQFDRAMNPKTTGLAGNYTILSSPVVGSRAAVRVAVRARYNVSNHSVTLTLVKPSRTALQVTIRGLVSAATGATLGKDTTFRL